MNAAAAAELDCAGWQRRLDGFLTARLGGAEEMQFREHAAACLPCGERLVSADPAALFMALAGESGLPHPLGNDEAQSMARRVSAVVAARRAERRLIGRRGALRWSLAAAAVLACGSLLALRGGAPETNVASPRRVPQAQAQAQVQAQVQPLALSLADSSVAEPLGQALLAEPLAEPLIDELGNPEARVYHLSAGNAPSEELQVVWIVDETLDI